MAYARIRPRSATLSDWTTINPVLKLQELGIVHPDTGAGTGKIKIKIGDGVTAFNDLPYAYNEDEINIEFDELTTHPTTKEGYGITDVYSKEETDNITGDLTQLQTTTQNGLVGAINEVNDLSRLLQYEIGKTLKINGAWCWFSYPQAIKYGDYTYFGCVDTSGNIVAARYYHTDKTIQTFTLGTFEVDDHNTPAFLRLASGKIAVFYTRHNADNVLRYRITSTADGFDFGTEQTLTSTAGNVTYSQVHRLTTTSKILWFYRTGDLTKWACRVSSDDGATWGSEVLIFSFNVQGYMKSTIRETGNVIMIGLSNHPDRSTTDHNIYAAFITDTLDIKGTYVGDSVLGNIGTGANLPISIANLTKVYDWTTNSEKAWIWDVANFAGGSASIVFSTLPSQQVHKYKYASLNYNVSPNVWDIYSVVDDTGGTISDSREPSYSGGITLCHEVANKGILYLSRKLYDKWIIEKWTTTDNGATWTTERIADGIGLKAVRPQSIINWTSDLPIIWMMGKYSVYFDYDTNFKIIKN